MAWSVTYDASALPASSSPAWTRNASAVPTTEAIVSGTLHIKQANPQTLYYEIAEAAPSTYLTASVVASAKWVSGDSSNVALQVRAKGKFKTQIALSSATSLLIETFNGTSWTSDTVAVAATGTTFHTVQIGYSAGVLTFYFDGVAVFTYSGTQHTAETENRVLFGDFAAGAVVSESIWDYVAWTYGATVTTKTHTLDGVVLESKTKTHSADGIVANFAPAARTLTKILTGEAASSSVRVFGATAGQAYRIYDSAGAVVQSAVANGSGIATFTTTGLPLTSGYIVGFTDNTYTTVVTGQEFFGSIRRGNVFEANPAGVGDFGFHVLAVDGSYYYPTSQYGGRSQIVQTADHIFALYRTGPASGIGSNVVAIRYNRATGQVDEGPTTVKANVTDGHELYGLAKGSDGKLRVVYGGTSSNLQMRISSAANSIAAFDAAVTIYAGSNAWPAAAGVYATETDGTNHMALGTTSGGDVIYGTATDAAPTTWTWTTIATKSATHWGALFGDLALYESGGTTKVGICFGSYRRSGTGNAATEFVNAYYMETSDDGATWKKASGSTISIPQAFNDTTGAVSGADQVSSLHHYGYWLHMSYVAGVPYVLLDNDLANLPVGTTPGVHSMAHWTGSAWTTNAIPDLPMWGNTPGSSDPAWNFFALHWAWGVLVSTHGSTLYVYAPRGLLINASTDTGHDGFDVVRLASTDGFATYTVETLLPSTYDPFSYAELDDGASRPAGAFGAGICYPKVPADDPLTVMFSVVDEGQSTIMLVRASKTLTHTIDGIVTASYSRALADTVTISDAISRVVTEGRPLADTLMIGDALARSAVAQSRTAGDTLTITDALDASSIASLTRDIADTVTIGDALARSAISFVRAIADTITITDSLSGQVSTTAPIRTVTRYSATTRPVGQHGAGTRAVGQHRSGVNP